MAFQQQLADCSFRFPDLRYVDLLHSSQAICMRTTCQIDPPTPYYYTTTGIISESPFSLSLSLLVIRVVVHVLDSVLHFEPEL